MSGMLSEESRFVLEGISQKVVVHCAEDGKEVDTVSAGAGIVKQQGVLFLV